jgi:hypothetical protein
MDYHPLGVSGGDNMAQTPVVWTDHLLDVRIVLGQVRAQHLMGGKERLPPGTAVESLEGDRLAVLNKLYFSPFHSSAKIGRKSKLLKTHVGNFYSLHAPGAHQYIDIVGAHVPDNSKVFDPFPDEFINKRHRVVMY